MKEHTNGPRADKRWAWVLVLGLLIVAGLGWGLFSTYSAHLPAISNKHAAWGTFGSLLSAFITLAGFVITISTLLFLNGQNQNQQSFINWQIKAQKFEQYINHRRLFVERLHEAQTAHDNNIQFYNPEHIYNQLFPNNSPTNLEFSSIPSPEGTEENLLSRLRLSFDELSELYEKAQWKDREIEDIPVLIIDINSRLGITWTGNASEGDLLWDGDNKGVNIYSIDESIKRAQTIYNSFLFYTGNPPFKGFNRGSSRFVRDALIQYYLHRRAPGHTLIANKANSRTLLLEELYFETDTLRDDDMNWLMPETYRHLEIIFSSKKSVNDLRESAAFIDMLNTGLNEFAEANVALAAQDPRHVKLHNCYERILLLIKTLR